MIHLARGAVLALILAARVHAAPPPAAATDGPRTPEAARIELRDQLGGSGSVAAHHGAVTVVMVVTAARLRNLKPWQRDLQERFADLDFVLVADIPETPAVSHEQVAGKLVLRVPAEVPVLIDLERRWATELELDTDRPNLLLFDRDGALVHRFRGRLDPELFEEVTLRLAALVGG